MRKILCLFLSLLLACCTPAAIALELTEDDLDQWFSDMVYLVEEIGIRKVDRPGEAEACEWLRETFESYGYSEADGTLYESRCQARERYENETISLIAVKPALNPNPQIITVSAHYDSVYEGARDNASGMAAVLFLARTFAQYEPFEDTELRFIAFGAEEVGMHGSRGYCAELTEDEIHRSLAVFNVDIITVDVWESLVLSLDSMGMRTADGYSSGTDDHPAYNRPVLAMLQAMEETGAYPLDDLEYSWNPPRHFGKSDHEPFHEIGVDAVNVCFHGTAEDGYRWPEFMHTPTDIIGDFDMDATWNALNALYTAVDGLAYDHTYGDQITEYPLPVPN